MCLLAVNPLYCFEGEVKANANISCWHFEHDVLYMKCSIFRYNEILWHDMQESRSVILCILTNIYFSVNNMVLFVATCHVAITVHCKYYFATQIIHFPFYWFLPVFSSLAVVQQSAYQALACIHLLPPMAVLSSSFLSHSPL